MTESARRDVETLLEALGRGDVQARQEIFALLYDELREQAARMVRDRHRNPSFDATVVVHEAYLRLVGDERRGWQDRAHFLAAAATAMRHVLVDHARSRGRLKRQAGRAAVPLDDVVALYEERVVDLEAFDRALARMLEFNPDMARAVELRIFAGASTEETARILGIPQRTFERRWQAAKAWLVGELA